MKASRSYAVVAVIAALTAGLSLTSAVAAEPAGAPLSKESTRPNFVVIQTDDQTVQDLVVMPAVKKLLQQRGTNFTQMMTPFAICCPSRAAMMSACYPHNNKVNENFPPDGGY